MINMTKKRKFDSESLKNFQIFNNLEKKQIDIFLPIIKEIKFQANDIIIHEGSKGNSILLLLDGNVEISVALTLNMYNSGADNREKSLIKLSSNFHPFFGEMCLFNKDDKRTATVKAATDCLIGRIEKNEFFKICNSNSEIGNIVMQNIATVMCKRLITANTNVLKLTTAFSLAIEK